MKGLCYRLAIALGLLVMSNGIQLIGAPNLDRLPTAKGRMLAARFDPDGSFWIKGDPPKGFEDFSEISLNRKHNRRLNPSGVQLVKGSRLTYKTLAISRQNLSFTTVTVGAISFSFSGRFLKGGTFYASDLDENKPVLEGLLTRFCNGQKVAAARLQFTYFGGT